MAQQFTLLHLGEKKINEKRVCDTHTDTHTHTVWTQKNEQIKEKTILQKRLRNIWLSRPEGLVLPWEPLAFCAWFVSAVNRLPTWTKKQDSQITQNSLYPTPNNSPPQP